MLKNLSPAALALGLFFVVACRPAARTVQPATAPDAHTLLGQQNVDAVIYQHYSAEVHRLFQQGYELARIRLDQALQRSYPLPPAVVVDIDETVLDNSPYQVTNAVLGRTYTPESWKQWTAKGSAKALPGAVDFLQYAVNKGCAVFYISNREVDELAPTLRNLAEQGFPMADAQHVLLMDGTSDKTARRAIVQRTHTIVLQAGDQLTDFDQRLKDRSTANGKALVDAMADTLRSHFIMLPNPMYGVWLDAITGRPLEGRAANKAAALKKDAY